MNTVRSANAMNTGQARVIDPILTEVAFGYTNPDRVGRILFPQITIAQRGGRVIQFDKSAFRLMGARRAPGGSIKRVQYGYQSDPIALVQDKLAGTVPYELKEEAMAIPGIDMSAMAVDNAMNSITLIEEYEQAQLALTASNYDSDHKVALTSTAKWSHADSDPGKQMDDYKEAIRSSIGVYPNTLVLSAIAFKAAKRNETIREQFKYTSAQSITLEMLKAYFEVETIAVGSALSVAENAPDNEDPTDIWGNNAVLAYVPRQAERSQGRPAYGYTYTLSGYPQAEEPWYDNDTGCWVYPVTHERRPYLVGATAGFLIADVN